MSERLHGIRRHLAVFVGVVAAGWCGAIGVHFMTSPTGTLGPTVLQSESPIRAAAGVLACFAAATIVAAVVARLTNAAVGLFVLGAGLWVMSVRTGTLLDLALSENGSLRLVALETAAWGIVLLIGSIVVFAAAGPLQDMRPREGEAEESAWSIAGLVSGAMGVLVIPGVLFIAQTYGKGQALAAVAIGAMAAGMTARVFRPGVQPILLFATPCLVGAIGHIIGQSQLSMPLDRAFVNRAFSALSVPMPIDYAAGALVGVSLGLGWARSFMHLETRETGHHADASKSPATTNASS